MLKWDNKQLCNVRISTNYMFNVRISTNYMCNVRISTYNINTNCRLTVAHKSMDLLDTGPIGCCDPEYIPRISGDWSGELIS